MNVSSPKTDSRQTVALPQIVRLRNAGIGIVAATLLSVNAGTAYAVNSDPGDYVPLPNGTNLFLQYFQFTHDGQIDLDGSSTQEGKLDSYIGIARFVHYTTVFGFAADAQVLVPFGGINNVSIEGNTVKATSGFSDPILAVTIWPISRTETATYLGITPLLYVPVGEYRPDDSVNMGNNRWQGDLQVGFQSAFGSSGLAKNGVFALYSDVNLYGNNNRYAGGERLSQQKSWQLQPWLTYSLNRTSNLSVGYSVSFGGREEVNGVYSGMKDDEQQVRFEMQKFITPSIQLAGEVTHDTHVLGGFRQKIGINLRLALLF